MHPDYSQSHTA